MAFTSKHTGAEIDAGIDKVQGIPSDATKNASDAQLRDRATHTGQQPASSIIGLSAVATGGGYGDLTGIPGTFPPSAHGHTLAEISDAGTAAAAATGDFAAASHGHTLAEISDAGTAAAAATGDFAAASHGHTLADISDSGTAAAAATGDFAAASHGHTLADISDSGTAAAAATGDFATAAQGALAGTALQPALTTNVDAQGNAIGGFIGNVVTGASGALTAATHSGKLLVTSGNVTVPTTTGFTCQIEAGGAHTVTFNGTTSAAMAAGDVMSILVTSPTQIRAALLAAADQVGFS